jgi:hypothetical protein
MSSPTVSGSVGNSEFHVKGLLQCSDNPNVARGVTHAYFFLRVHASGTVDNSQLPIAGFKTSALLRGNSQHPTRIGAHIGTLSVTDAFSSGFSAFTGQFDLSTV